MRFFERLAGLSKFIVYGFALVILLFLTITAWICADNDAKSFINFSDLLIALVVMLLIALVLGLSAKLLERFPRVGNITLFVFVFICVIAGCSWWIVNSDALPSSDAKSVFDIAVRAMNHDLRPFAPTGSYMSLCPYQSGLVLYDELILRFFPGEADYLSVQWCNLILVALSLVSGFFIVRRWFASSRVCTFWCLLMLFCLPYYFLVNYMYGDIPSIGMIFFAVWMITEYLQRRKLWLVALAALGMAGAVAVRKNSLIFVIACALLLGVISICEKNVRLFIVTVALTCFTIFAGSFLPKAFYEHRANNTMGEGMPTISYIAMGLQDGGGTFAGAWNGYHSDMFIEYNYDDEMPTKLSKQSIKDSLSNMAANPDYAVDFFSRKLVAQWCDETFNSIFFTQSLFNNRSDVAWKIYEGEWYPILCKWMDWYQNLVYAGGFLFCLRAGIRWKRRKSKVVEEGKPEVSEAQGINSVWKVTVTKNTDKNEWVDLWKLVFLTTLIGGFLFSMIWEAGSRYVMPYFVMLLPYAAAGLTFHNEKFKK